MGLDITLVTRGCSHETAARLLGDHDVRIQKVEESPAAVLTAAQDGRERSQVLVVLGGPVYPEPDPAFDAIARDLDPVPGFSAAFTALAIREIGSTAIRQRSIASSCLAST